MTDDVSKLPAFPRHDDMGGADFDWLRRDRDAYKERVEALKKYAKHNDDCDALRDDIYRLRGCTCGLDALLAACERKEG
jgi:hypothetical protein